uniref:Putative secreted protein n=1 Tax=Anopheles triannulatus TaxID=58253 RepID=A0A2M4B0S1_9DIPT
MIHVLANLLALQLSYPLLQSAATINQSPNREMSVLAAPNPRTLPESAPINKGAEEMCSDRSNKTIDTINLFITLYTICPLFALFRFKSGCITAPRATVKSSVWLITFLYFLC